MAQFDPTVIGAIGQNTPNVVPDTAGSYEKALTIKDMMDRTQMNRLQLDETKRAQKEQRDVDAILKDSDYSTPKGLSETASKVNRVSPKSAMDLMKWGQTYQSGEVKRQMDQLTLAGQRQDLIVAAIDPIVAQAREMKNGGASDLEVRAFITQQMPGALQQLRSQKMSDGQPALPDDQLKMATSVPGGYTLAAIESWESKSKAGVAAIKQRLEQFKADTQARGQGTRDTAESEKEKHDRATEASQARRDAIAANKSKGFDDRESELLASLADRNVSLPAGLRSQAQIKSTIDGLFAKHPDLSADQIADGIRSGKLKLAAESKAAGTAGTQIGKVALAANELDSFGDQVLTASANLPRNLPVGLTVRGLIQMGQKQASSTGLLALKLKLQALNNAYDQLSARGGTDAEKRAHIHELFDSRLTDEGIRALVTGVKQEAEGARQAANRTIAETSGTAIPGAGGSGAAIPGTGAAPVAPAGGAPAAPGGGAVVDWSSLK
jgi:hypothetical protein